MSWSFVLSSGGDITSLVDITSVVKTRRLHSELKPNVNKCEFRAMFDATLWIALLATEDITATITKDGVTYFYGYVSPNFSTEILQGRKWISIIIEDPTLKTLGKTIVSPLIYVGAKVCDPGDTAHSLVHLLCTAAGVTLSGPIPTNTAIIPYVAASPDDKTSIAAILGDLLYCYSYCYCFADDGTLAINPTVNAGTVTTTDTLDIVPNGGAIRRSLQSRKTAKKYDDIRVRFDSVEMRSGITLFKETTNAQGSVDCLILLNANGDADGKDYYPKGSGASEVYCEWSNPDGLSIIAVTSAALDMILGSSLAPTTIVISRPLTNYIKRASFSLHNTAASIAGAGLFASLITRLRIKGDAWVKTAENVARSSNAGTLLLEYKAKYIFETASAQALALALAQYYAHSTETYNARSKADIAIGAYVLVSDSVYSGRAQKCRVVGRKYLDYERVSEYDLEAVADYVAVDLITEGTAVTGTTSSSDQLQAMADDSVITPQEKSSIALRWQDINGDGSTSGSYWATRAAALKVGMPTTSIDLTRSDLAAYLTTTPAVLSPATWSQNIAINAGTFSALWSDYYKAEAAMGPEITRWSRYAPATTLDCGECLSASETPASSDYDCGEYPDWSAPATQIDCGECLSSVEVAAHYIDCGEVDASIPTTVYDCGEVLTSPPVPYPPRRNIDCGVVE